MRRNSTPLKYPNSFGSIMEGRSYQADTSLRYRFGFNGKVKDDETYGDGNIMDFGDRLYDSRLGRWFSVDPLFNEYVSQSPFTYALNDPISNNDPNGQWVEKQVVRKDKNGNIKKWYQFWIKTTVKEITFKIHGTKLYYGAYQDVPMSSRQEKNFADNFKREFESKGKGEYEKNNGKKIKVNIEIAGDIEIVGNWSKVKFNGFHKDHLFYIADYEGMYEYEKERNRESENSTLWVGLTRMQGNTNIVLLDKNKPSQTYSGTAIHEFLHSIGLLRHAKDDKSLFYEGQSDEGTLQKKDLKRIKQRIGLTLGARFFIRNYDYKQKEANKEK